jgi:hypothetical protein
MDGSSLSIKDLAQKTHIKEGLLSTMPTPFLYFRLDFVSILAVQDSAYQKVYILTCRSDSPIQTLLSHMPIHINMVSLSILYIMI